MLGQFGVNSNTWTTSPGLTGANPGIAMGLTNTPGGNGVKGGWRALSLGANLAYDAYGFMLLAGGTLPASTIPKSVLLDIGIDPTGNQNFTQLAVVDLMPGVFPNSIVSLQAPVYLPLHIRAGASVAVRSAVLAPTPANNSITLAAKFFCAPTQPHNVRVAQYTETIGDMSTPGRGTNIDSGYPTANNTKGPWVEIGTASKPLWYIHFGVQCSRNEAVAMTTAYFLFDVAYGDETDKTPIFENRYYSSTSSGGFTPSLVSPFDNYCDVPAGAKLYTRFSTNTLTANYTGYNANITGFGG